MVTFVGSLTGLASPLGLAVAGPVADALGVGAWFIVGGVACILMGVVGLTIPAVLNIEGGRAGPAKLEAAEIQAPEHEPQ
jgi:DHA3 family macrolide efflux protein-like MFS transporter